MNSLNKEKDKMKKRSIFCLVSTVLMFSMILCACGKKEKVSVPEELPTTWQEQYDLGVRYLSEGNYEEAIIAFVAAIEIDPKNADAYLSLAEVYRSQGDHENMMETLRVGYEKTESSLLERYIRQEELNEIIERDGYADLLSGLYQVAASGNKTAMIDEMKKYSDFFISNKGKQMRAPNLRGYLFDGKEFSAAEDGLGLLFLADSRKIYWGEIRSGIPNGKGTLMVITSVYGKGGINGFVCSGTWLDGKVMGEAQIITGYSSDLIDNIMSFKEISCVFDENEVMKTGAIIHQFTISNWSDTRKHQVHYTVIDGKLVQSDWVYDDLENRYQIPCELHTDCESLAIKSDFGGEKYQNPYNAHEGWPSNPYDFFFDGIGYSGR